MGIFWLVVLVLIFIVIVAAILVRPRISRSSTIAENAWSANLLNIIKDNADWRRVLGTWDGLQVVAMTTPPGDSLGWEVHKDKDQFFKIESGHGVLSTASICAEGYPVAPVNKIELAPGVAAVVPQGLCHNINNTGTEPLKMYTIYGSKLLSPHKRGLIDHTHQDELVREGTGKN